MRTFVFVLICAVASVQAADTAVAPAAKKKLEEAAVVAPTEAETEEEVAVLAEDEQEELALEAAENKQ